MDASAKRVPTSLSEVHRVSEHAAVAQLVERIHGKDVVHPEYAV